MKGSKGIRQGVLAGAIIVSALILAAAGFAANSSSGWTIVPGANTSATEPNEPMSVTCASASDCWAVGYVIVANGDFHTLIEHWNGAAWSVVTSPNTASQYNILEAVACSSTAQCFAVGYTGTDQSTNQTLILRWNGTVWSIVTSANTSAADDNSLSGVTCTSATQCWAVGSFNDGPSEHTLVERWDGFSWAIVASPNVSAATGNSLAGVTCSSASQCWAVGYSNDFDDTLVEQWNGSAWSIVPFPATGTPGGLNATTCTSSSQCWAVGEYFDGDHYRTLIQSWNGTAWAVAASPNSSPTLDQFLSGVACASGAQCWAVGYDEGVADRALILQWNGATWSVLSALNSPGSNFDLLYSASCTSALQCWTVGTRESGGTDQTLLEAYTMLNITSIARLPNAHILIQGQGMPSSVNKIQAASNPNPSGFTTLQSVTADSSGNLSFEDANAGSFSRRFYRLAFP